LSATPSDANHSIVAATPNAASTFRTTGACR
jgi:hypothetical protein